MDAKEEIRSRLNIEDVIGEYVELKRAGRSYKGLSPFTGEKTPSFFVSPEKNIWHDFSSNKGGDVFAFVMEAEGMDFRQAMEFLARKAGVDLSEYQSAGARKRSAYKKRLLAANELAARYFQQSLLRSQQAIEYVFKQRGLSRQTVQDFQIGYAPDSGTALLAALEKRGFTKREINDAGLLNRYGKDLFRGRMMIPLMDQGGQVIGFTGRIIGSVPNAPKYLNTPQTLLYDKGRHIFALSQAKEAIRKSGFVVMVEGNLDVVSSHQAGVAQTVATAGTSMTENHLKAVKRLTSDIRLCYDSDKAGVAATERAIELASHEGVELTIISLPDGAKDPDELIKSSVQAWREAITRNEPAVEWVLRQHAGRCDLDTAVGRRTFTTAALRIVRGLADPVEREYYIKRIATMSHTSEEAVRQKLAGEPVKKQTFKPVVANTSIIKNKQAVLEDNILALALYDARCLEELRRAGRQQWSSAERELLATVLLEEDDPQNRPKKLQKADIYVKMVSLRAEERYAAWDSGDRYVAMCQLLRDKEDKHNKQTQQELLAKLRDAEAAGDEAAARELRAALNNIIKEKARDKRRPSAEAI
ncbi:MAG: DNA primase [Candidatus Nanosynbacter sp.]|nr:DNA primase [Candidatus Nanosynbacter sp.]